jgi:WD40 repeat protein
MFYRKFICSFARGVLLSATLAPMNTLCGQTSTSPDHPRYLSHLAAANSSLRLNEASEALRWLDEIPESARAWEWQFLYARADSSKNKLSTASWTPLRIDLSANGDRLAIAGADGLVRIYQSKTLDLIAEWRVSEQSVYAARFHPEGHQLAVCSRDGQISVWGIANQERLWTQKSGGEGLADLVFRPDGSQLLFCSWYRGETTVQGIVSTWDSSTGKQLWKTTFGVKPIVTARYSPDGKHFAVGTWDALVGVWPVDTVGEPQVFDFADRPQYSAIDDIAFSPDSKQLAAATKNGTPRIWTLDKTKPAIDMIGHSNAVFSIAFSTDGKSLLTGGSDGVMTVWDCTKRVPVHHFYGHTNRIQSICVDQGADRAFTAASDNTLRVWDLGQAGGFESPEASKYAYGMALANDGKSLVTGGQSDTTITVWDERSKKSTRHFAGTSNTINYLDGDGGDFIAGGNWNGDVCIWRVSTGEVVRKMGTKELGGMQQCSLSDDSKWLASATNKKQVVVWHADTGELAKIIPMPDGCWGIDFSSDGQALVVGDGKGMVHWIATADWATAWSCHAGLNQVNAVRIARSGEWLAAGTEGGVLSIIDVKQQRLIHQKQAHSERIWSLDISPDDQRIVTGSADRKVKTWEPKSGVLLLTLADFSDAIYNVRFSPDGKSLFLNSLGSRILKLTTRSMQD